MKVNNRGQALVPFILILPIILLVLAVVVEQGMLLSEKNNLSNLAVDTCKYFNKDNQEIKNILLENDSNLINIKIIREKDKIREVSFSKEKNAIFGKIVGYKKYNIRIKKECKRGEF